MKCDIIDIQIISDITGAIMPALLIRDIPETTKQSLAVRAARNGRSQQAEALSILEHELNPSDVSWVQLLLDGSAEVGGIGFPDAKRHAPRITGIEL